MTTVDVKSFQRYKTNKFFVGSVAVSIGILLATTGGSWDITNHLINKPETFFSAPHTVLYAGAGIAVFGTILMVARYRSRIDSRGLPTKMAVVGTVLLVGAGPADFSWHQAFGLDGLLSPTHMMLVVGMLALALGGFLGIRYSIVEKTNAKPMLTTILSMLPVWLAAAGVIDLLSLPFSNTEHFKFNPDPTLAAMLTTVAFPFLTSIVLYSASTMAKMRFGYLSALGASFVTVDILTSIIPDEKVLTSIPFYLINLIPIVTADLVLSFTHKRAYSYLAGAILGLGFFTLYFPLITHTYNELTTTAPVWPTAIITTYFANVTKFYPIVALPAIALGIFGVSVGRKIFSKQLG